MPSRNHRRSSEDAGISEFIVQACTTELLKVNDQLRREIGMRRRLENEHLKLIEELRNALKSSMMLSGHIPLCAFCKDMHDGNSCGDRPQTYISRQRTGDVHRDD
jgi:hypothetical protein